MYVKGTWHTLRPRVRPAASDPIGALDVSVLQDQLLAPILKIADVRTDKRIDFVGGARGTGELEKLVDSGKAAVAFSLHPVSVADLMAVSDAGAIMWSLRMIGVAVAFLAPWAIAIVAVVWIVRRIAQKRRSKS